MVNIFQRLARRAQSPSRPDAGTEATSPSMRRTLSISSGKRSRPQEERSPRHLILISDTPEFDPHISHRFQAEGFNVSYLPFLGSGDAERDRKALENAVHEKEDELETGERYAIVAYHRPAYLLLAAHHLTISNTNPFPRLCALIAYYPLSSTDKLPFKQKEDGAPLACSNTASIFNPSPTATYLPIQIHLPGPLVHSCTLWPWVSLSASEGDLTYRKRHRCHVFAYPDADTGFAENSDAVPESPGEPCEGGDHADEISSQLAWSRTLGCLRRAFGVGSHWAVVDIETVWEEYWERVLGEWGDLKPNEYRDSGAAVDMLLAPVLNGDDEAPRCETGASVQCVPTRAGGECPSRCPLPVCVLYMLIFAGCTPSSLQSFFAHVFVPIGPVNQHIRLLSRTVGPDRIVDEILLSFCHTAEIPWLLPEVSPTNRDVKVVVVVMARFCAGRIAQQKLYWDQADVLVQVGLLEAGFVPQAKGSE
ncbi:hypothetical protein NUU61_003744 [Penicillium alfredii]|uniref:Dienelactone hydrolase n=1 Tax=Penicillium alfredii TaxID=1506179 RepID=A0A9W9KDY3_9EURO|nr:uncharacterized protein NUU61_003744 [Penicillium alfredii]KAJ5101522.1 hypothetical protein NUU61_003744 [Penicillium alfredii]